MILLFFLLSSYSTTFFLFRFTKFNNIGTVLLNFLEKHIRVKINLNIIYIEDVN